MLTTSYAPSDALASLKVQGRVIGAIMLRELHTRFGRNNIGYLWLVVEPMILSGGVSLFHLFYHINLPFNFSPGPFYASGYITFIVFRNNVNRSAGLIESNRPLLYHRNVTLLDLSVARTLLDTVASLGAMIIMFSVFILFGLSTFPERPWFLLLGLGLMSWLSGGVAMMVTSAAALYPNVTERIVHPATYLVLPFSGMLFIMDELPRSFARLVSWFPFPHATDLVRMGVKADFNSSYASPAYLVLWCASVTLLGMLGLRIARRNMHFD